MKLPPVAVIDFETFKIEPRPAPPPAPVGLAYKFPKMKAARYLAFGHPLGGNTHSFADAKAVLEEIWAGALAGKWHVLAHNVRFDILSVATHHFSLPILPPEVCHDTMPLLFLRDPRAATYSLKPSAETILGIPKSDRDAVEDWLVLHQPCMPEVKLSRSRSPSKKVTPGKARLEYVGGYIAYAPVPLVSTYACGDVMKALGLWNKVGPEIINAKMWPAYERERDLLWPIWEMEQRGVPVDLKRLATDTNVMECGLSKVDSLLGGLAGNNTVNWDSADELVEALSKAGKLDKNLLPKTPTGKVSTAKDGLEEAITDPKVLALLKYRSRLANSLRTFMSPWLRVASKPESKGRIFTTWHATRTDENGARTGRLSSTPNFQNLTKKKVDLWGGKPAPKWWAAWKLPELPLVRSYIAAEDGKVLVDRDYSQQEIRVLAHYTRGTLLEKFQSEPWFDAHEYAKDRICEAGIQVTRSDVKSTVFGLIYGMGLGKLAIQLDRSVAEVRAIKQMVLDIFPGLRELNKVLKDRAKSNMPITTWGGRRYFCEPPKMVDGELRTYEYKMINVLIQASSADCTKQAVINFWRVKKPKTWEILLTVHDEIMLQVPKKDVVKAHALLCKCMLAVNFDVAMLSEGKTGPTWSTLQTYDKKGSVECQPK